jgi:penicillin-binding protein 1C
MLAAERRAVGGTGDFGAARILRPGPDSAREEICALSGLVANPWCPNRRHEWVAAEVPLLPCSWHHLADDGLLTILPAEYQGWQGATVPRSAASRVARTAGVEGGHVRRAGRQGRDRHAPALAISSPADGSTYLIDPTLRREFQSLSLKAVTSAAGRIAWTIDGRPAGSTSGGASLAWPLVPGRHVIEARDADGRTARAQITVR